MRHADTAMQASMRLSDAAHALPLRKLFKSAADLAAECGDKSMQGWRRVGLAWWTMMRCGKTCAGNKGGVYASFVKCSAC